MFKRTLQVQLAKPSKTVNENQASADDSADKLIQVSTEAIKNLMTEGAKLVAGYIVLDTARKVLIAKANH